MGGARSRSKGQRFEREVRDLVRKAGFWAERGRSQSAGGGEADPDVRTDIPGIHLEAKHQQAVPKKIYDFMQQAIDDCGHSIPIVVMRRDREVPLVVMRFEDWLARESERWT